MWDVGKGFASCNEGRSRGPEKALPVASWAGYGPSDTGNSRAASKEWLSLHRQFVCKCSEN